MMRNDIAWARVFFELTRSPQCWRNLQDGRYLDFLGVLCVCDGIAIPDNQGKQVCMQYRVECWWLLPLTRETV